MLSKETVIVMHHYLQQGLSQTAIARKLGVDRRTIYRYRKRGNEELSYGPRQRRPSQLDPFKAYIRGRLELFPELSLVRLLQELRDLGYEGGPMSLSSD